MTDFKNLYEYNTFKKYKINSFNGFYTNVQLPTYRELNGIKFFYIEEEMKLELKSNFNSKYILLELLVKVLENEYSGDKILIFNNIKHKISAEKLMNINDLESLNEVNKLIKIDEIIETDEEIKFEIYFNSIEDFKEEINYIYFMEIEGFHKLYFLWKQITEYNNN